MIVVAFYVLVELGGTWIHGDDVRSQSTSMYNFTPSYLDAQGIPVKHLGTGHMPNKHPQCARTEIRKRKKD